VIIIPACRERVEVEQDRVSVMEKQSAGWGILGILGILDAGDQFYNRRLFALHDVSMAS
jgi:hypothetical protein